MSAGGHDLSSAVHDFWRARRRANLREALSFLRREPTELLSYEEVRHKLRAVEESTPKLEEVPLDDIVGSVGRYNDFTRGFLPRQDSDKERWARVLTAMTGLAGVPPIEVYRIGDAYFVKDGNHRVSVARQLGVKYLQAYVTPVRARVQLDADVGPDDLISKAEYADFLIETRVDELRPDAELTLTVPGHYGKLLEHISVHRYFMGIDERREVLYPEAVTHWYDEVYLPVVQSIRRNGLLRGFPGRTETDLYLWLSEHRGELERELGWSLAPETVAQGVAEEVAGAPQVSPERRERVLRDATEREGTGPQAVERICRDVLVALPDGADGLVGLEQALVVAIREDSRLYGLHVVESDGKSEVRGLRQAFDARCRQAGVAAQFATTEGQVQERLLARARWSDLVVAPLPSDEEGKVRLSAGYRSFLRRSPRPVLTVRGAASELNHALLAYDGGTRANAALFVATYIALKWKTSLAVLSVNELGQAQGSVLDRAREYLEAHGVEAVYLSERGRVGPTIVAAAQEHGCDTVLMGSYKYSRRLEAMLGGVLEEVLGRVTGAVLVA